MRDDHHEFECKLYNRISKRICRNCNSGYHYNSECIRRKDSRTNVTAVTLTTERQTNLNTESSKAEEIEANLLKFAKPRELKSNDYPDSCMTQPEMLRKLIAQKIMPETGSTYAKYLEKRMKNRLCNLVSPKCRM